MRIIDAHNHPDWHGYDLKKFIANMDQYGIERTWLLTWECPDDEYGHGSYAFYRGEEGGPMPFSRCRYYGEQAPDRFVLGYAPDPRRPDAIDRLAAAQSLYGVKVCGELKVRMMYDNWDALRMFRFCGKQKLPVTVHIDYEFDHAGNYPRPNWWYGGGIEAFERAIDRCPDTVFLGHGPGFWAHISNDGKHDKEGYPKGKVVRDGAITRMLRKYPNFYCDLSAGSGCNSMTRDLDHAKEFLLEFQDRVLFARDYFDNQHREMLDALGLPQTVLEKIYSGNALKLVPV